MGKKTIFNRDSVDMGNVNILTKIFRSILVDLNINAASFNRLLTNYVNNPLNGIGTDSRDKTNTKSNLSKELKKDKMTWGVFEKAMRFLNPIKAEFNIKLTWKGDKVTEHNIVIIDREKEKKTE